MHSHTVWDCALSRTVAFSLTHTHTQTFSVEAPTLSAPLWHAALGLSLRSEDIEHLCGSAELAECQRVGQGPFRLHGREHNAYSHTYAHTCTHLCTCQFPVKHTEGMEQESVLESFATSQFAEHKPAAHIRTHHMSKSLTPPDSNGWKDSSRVMTFNLL